MNTILVTLCKQTSRSSQKHFENLKWTSHLQPTKGVVTSYSGDGPGPLLPLLGCFTTSLGRNQKSILEVLYLVKGQGKNALLSCQAGENMGLIECHIEQTTKAPSPVMEVEQPERKNFIAEYENVSTKFVADCLRVEKGSTPLPPHHYSRINR